MTQGASSDNAVSDTPGPAKRPFVELDTSQDGASESKRQRTTEPETSQAKQERTTQHNSQSRLLILPGELRNSIYEHCFSTTLFGEQPTNRVPSAPSDNIILHHDPQHLRPATIVLSQQRAFTQVCRQTRTEFLPMLLKSVTVHIYYEDVPAYISTFLQGSPTCQVVVQERPYLFGNVPLSEQRWWRELKEPSFVVDLMPLVRVRQVNPAFKLLVVSAEEVWIQESFEFRRIVEEDLEHVIFSDDVLFEFQLKEHVGAEDYWAKVGKDRLDQWMHEIHPRGGEARNLLRTIMEFGKQDEYQKM
ncbi:hypothetical protein CC86DRAFT_468307 [Ophiobolus disseminans]|uniref:Uncharacterized protein n=1 Tax=Ophiobolus disseminans TaxID=1469910 RepID=A0A6A6ZUH6_9PLEO|nr:hypothetical protein CC86DRAFT_468307 [Ophiobolus disseminans]